MTAPPFLMQGDPPAAPDWPRLVAALEAGHKAPRAEIADVFLGPPERTLLSRAARIPGMGSGVKSVTVVPENAARDMPTIQGAMLVFDDDTGRHLATLDSALVTNLKTVADALLGAKLLSRPDSRRLLIVGAGSVAETLAAAYPVLFPGLEQIEIWNRTPQKAEDLAQKAAGGPVPVTAVSSLGDAVQRADIISTATMARAPVVLGEWLTPGTHLDLIGAFRADMREVDDAALLRAKLFVDSRDTTLDHIGELKIPLAAGVISPTDILADLYDFASGTPGRTSPSDITLFKNGGGAHLDLMIAFALVETTGHT
ncbi:ornithine cyclodeaminase [uncultured Tateyamaria sp.]|uniref:ornithine cyclodeaminase family protein n=1 Tax=uncultured Tateyamaria sp. TaxID=455651 RepID=UPI00261EE925|nr:ornithine cyclodeaminase [uncultured Tateyamaria sp.]